jgi:hypothetical protein
MNKFKNLIGIVLGYNTHLVCIIAIVVGMPLSKFLMSLATICLVAHWFLEGQVIKRFTRFFNNRIAIITTITFFIFLIGLIYSKNIDYAFKDIRLKVPLLAFPVIFSSSHKIKKQHFYLILKFFVAATLISTIYGFLAYKNVIPARKEITDMRSISQFISHIRLSLMIILSMFLLPVLLRKNWKQKIIGIIILMWFAYFLSLIESVTGFIIGCLTLILISIYLSYKNKNWLTIIPASITIIIILILSLKLTTTYHTIKIDTTHLEEYTKHGEKYNHYSDFVVFDNGNYSNQYIAINELEIAWNERSKLDFQGENKEKKGYGLRFYLIRYLTSKGLRKDYEGVYKLTEQDVENIENGIPNYLLTSNDLMSRLKLTMFEMDGYIDNANVNGNSFAQRLVYWKLAKNIGRKNFWIGVGTGDVGDAFKEYYNRSTTLKKKFQLRSHNQYLSTFIALGFIGVVIFIFTLITPLLFAIKNNNYLYVVFACIALTSFLSEDTLETQDGVFFFAFFNSFLLFTKIKKNHVQ